MIVVIIIVRYSDMSGQCLTSLLCGCYKYIIQHSTVKGFLFRFSPSWCACRTEFLVRSGEGGDAMCS